MLYKNLLTKELYASIPSTELIAELFEKGMKMGSTQLAVSAMEELILRGDTDLVFYGLEKAFDTENGYVKLGSSMSSMIARSLIESNRETDPILRRFGKGIFLKKNPIEFAVYKET